MKTKAVVFDLVGTLIYVKGSVGLIYSDVAKKYGYKTDPIVLNNVFKELFSSREKPVGGDEEEKKWWKVLVDDTYSKAGYDLGNDIEKIFEESFLAFSNKSSWIVYSDVVSVLDELKNRGDLKLAILSNFDSRLENILDGLGLLQYFDLLVYSGRAGYSKPDSRIFNYALRNLDVLPEEVLYIGDSLDMDYEPAKALNINALLVDRDNNYANTANLVKTSSLEQVLDFVS